MQQNIKNRNIQKTLMTKEEREKIRRVDREREKNAIAWEKKLDQERSTSITSITQIVEISTS
jgi:hypothetical protein